MARTKAQPMKSNEDAELVDDYLWPALVAQFTTDICENLTLICNVCSACRVPERLVLARVATYYRPISNAVH